MNVSLANSGPIDQIPRPEEIRNRLRHLSWEARLLRQLLRISEVRMACVNEAGRTGPLSSEESSRERGSTCR